MAYSIEDGLYKKLLYAICYKLYAPGDKGMRIDQTKTPSLLVNGEGFIGDFILA